MTDLYIASDKPEAPIVPSAPAPLTSPPEQPSVSVPETPPAAIPGKIKLTKNEPHILTCYHENPEGVQFENQQPGERVILFLRRHYTTNLGWEITSLVLILIPLILLAIYPSLSLSFAIPVNYFIVIGIFYYLIILGYMLINYVIWFYNVGIVSNMRVIDIDVTSISSKDVAATALSDIIDISYKQNGFQQNLFDFGDVFMETQANTPNFEFLQVPHPGRITEVISTLIAKRAQ